MPKSKHRKKNIEKKKAKKKEILLKKKRLNRYMSEFEKHSKLAELEKSERRRQQMSIIKDWGESEDRVTPTQEMLM